MTESTRLTVINPATGERIEEVASATRKSINSAVEEARRGFREWRRFAGLDRAGIFHDISRGLMGTRTSWRRP